jgi:hypothetical protein
MNLRLILPAAAAVLLAASCTPYVEPPPEQPTDPAGRKPTPEEQEKIRQQREEQKKKDEANQTPDRDTKPEGETGAITEQPKNEGSGGDGGSAPEKPASPQKEIPVARPVPGKPGMVFSPFNNKVIDVKGIPSGRLVADPTYPASEKKHFRVP